ncbi:methyltransferase domain-containing protein [Candidatus Uhrbacteria bacterium]|nr:methyltransferase domain-containing protein [Candidatus Uhrbacteria bacterium]
MKRIKDGYLDTITSHITLQEKTVLEIGCGEGRCTIQLAQAGAYVTGIDPDAEAINRAQEHYSQFSNARFRMGKADDLPFPKNSFDVVLFTLSFHHIAPQKMFRAIDESIRVTKPYGYVIFLEPAFIGSFFEAEILFDACDGDERREKKIAYATMLSHPFLEEIWECSDETLFAFDSVADFETFMKPKRNHLDLEKFFTDHNFVLSAQRRINIFKPRK